MNNVRREKIREFIEANQVVTLHQLMQLMPDVSLMTLHRDLSYLQDLGIILKIRGGARYLGDSGPDSTYAAREASNKAAKEVIAEKALPLVGGSASVYLDAGSTVMALARRFPDGSANVLTAGANTALELARRPGPSITLCGGSLNRSSFALSGSAAVEMLSSINIQAAFLAASGYSAGAGFTCGSESEARTKALVVRRARIRVMLVDSSKLERLTPYTFAGLKDFTHLITEKKPEELPQAFLEACVATGTEVI